MTITSNNISVGLDNTICTWLGCCPFWPAEPGSLSEGRLGALVWCHTTHVNTHTHTSRCSNTSHVVETMPMLCETFAACSLELTGSQSVTSMTILNCMSSLGRDLIQNCWILLVHQVWFPRGMRALHKVQSEKRSFLSVVFCSLSCRLKATSRCYWELKIDPLGVYFSVSRFQFFDLITASQHVYIQHLFFQVENTGLVKLQRAFSVSMAGVSSARPPVVHSSDEMSAWVWFMQAARGSQIYHVYGNMFECNVFITALLCHKRFCLNDEMMGESLSGRRPLGAHGDATLWLQPNAQMLLMCIWQYLWSF